MSVDWISKPSKAGGLRPLPHVVSHDSGHSATSSPSVFSISSTPSIHWIVGGSTPSWFPWTRTLPMITPTPRLSCSLRPAYENWDSRASWQHRSFANGTGTRAEYPQLICTVLSVLKLASSTTTHMIRTSAGYSWRSRTLTNNSGLGLPRPIERSSYYVVCQVRYTYPHRWPLENFRPCFEDGSCDNQAHQYFAFTYEVWSHAWRRPFEVEWSKKSWRMLFNKSTRAVHRAENTPGYPCRWANPV